MSTKKLVIGTAVVIVGMPIAAVLVTVATVYTLDRTYGRTNGSIISSGRRREYLLYVPKRYDRGRPTPLVVSLHGAMNWPAFQMKISQWNKAADDNGFIVVYPAGAGTGPKTWFMEGARTPQRMPDVRFVAELIDTLAATYNIDPTRIYANGMSNGGGMAFALSCTLADRIAAIGAVSAAQSLPWSWCADSTPVPMIAFHGTADRFVPYDGAPPSWLSPAPFPSVRTWVAEWAQRNRCAPKPVDSAVAQDVTRSTYTHCADNASVVLYTIAGGGHQWPGGKPIAAWLVGPMSRSIDATGVMWAFFREHRLRRAGTALRRR